MQDHEIPGSGDDIADSQADDQDEEGLHGDLEQIAAEASHFSAHDGFDDLVQTQDVLGAVEPALGDDHHGVDQLPERAAPSDHEAGTAEGATAEPSGLGSKSGAVSTKAFLGSSFTTIRDDPDHPLRFLLERRPDGQLDWRKTLAEKVSGPGFRYGRYEGNDEGAVVQVGHLAADTFTKQTGGRVTLALEDADLNQMTGQTIESKDAYSFKDAVLIGGVDFG
jgi:Bacterial toxin 5